ncbi:MAG: hypothetical protein IPJ79_10970 [Bacteroidetes bacterium]|nr:hypothetical protein [Bacteroidota bacterium]
MKIKSSFAVAAMIALGFNSFSQSKYATTKWGPELKGSKRGTLTETIGYDESGYYVRGTEKGDIYLEKLDKNLNRVATWEFEEKDPDTKEKYSFEGITYFNDKLLLFKTSVDKKTDKATLYVNNVNKKTMAATGKTTKLMEMDYEKKGGGIKFGVSMEAAMAMAAEANTKFIIVESREKQKLLIISNPTPTDKEANDRFGLVVLDTVLNKTWTKNAELPYNNKLFRTQKWVVDDAGNAYVLGKLYKDKVKEVKRGQQNFKYHIVAFTSKGENKVDYEISIPEKFVNDINFKVNDAGDIVCAGFYSKMGRTSVDGCFYTVLDGVSKNVKVTNVKEFDIDFLTEGMSERQEKKARAKEEKGKDLELYQYDMDNMILRDDGGCVLVGEQYFVKVTTHYSQNGTTTTYTYYYNDIIVINVTPEGKIDWATKVPKYQRTTNDNGAFSSYAMEVTKDKIAFVFNDHKDNLNPTKQGDIKNFSLRDKNGIITIATVDNAGKTTRESLFSAAETDVFIRPKVCEQFSESQMLLFGERGKTEQFAIVSFK